MGEGTCILITARGSRIFDQLSRANLFSIGPASTLRSCNSTELLMIDLSGKPSKSLRQFLMIFLAPFLTSVVKTGGRAPLGFSFYGKVNDVEQFLDRIVDAKYIEYNWRKPDDRPPSNTVLRSIEMPTKSDTTPAR